MHLAAESQAVSIYSHIATHTEILEFVLSNITLLILLSDVNFLCNN